MYAPVMRSVSSDSQPIRTRSDKFSSQPAVQVVEIKIAQDIQQEQALDIMVIVVIQSPNFVIPS